MNETAHREAGRRAGEIGSDPGRHGSPGESSGRSHLPIAAEGWPFIATCFAVATALAVAGIAWPAALWLAAVFALLGVFCAFFFRDPERTVPVDVDAIVSAADGRVVQVAREEHGTRVAIFLNIFDVHVNRSPYEGEVSSSSHTPGRFVPASRDDAGRVNERNELILTTRRGEIRVAQIAGLVARRIVCRVQSGDRMSKGERFGLIRFGSRTELLLPPEAAPVVAVGDRVRGGESVVARFEDRARSPAGGDA